MATAVTNAAEKAVKKVIRTVKVPIQFGREKGHQIFVYSHLQTNQVVYSLTRHLNVRARHSPYSIFPRILRADRTIQNTRALKQLPFLGKNTVPAALRKDHWSPLCVLSFPKSSQGLDAYTKLRAFRELHETAYPLSIVTQTEGKNAGTLMTKKDKGKVLMDQKANTVADMAAVLAIQARPPSPEVIERMKKRVRTDGRSVAKRGLGSQRTANVFEFQGKVDGVSIWWASMLDAEYAATWPEEVKHGKLAVDRGTAIWPPPLDLAHQEMNVEVEEKIKAPGPLERIMKPLSKREKKGLTAEEKQAKVAAREAENRRTVDERKRVEDEEAARQTALRAKGFLEKRPQSVKRFDKGVGEMSITEKIRDADMRARAWEPPGREGERLRA